MRYRPFVIATLTTLTAGLSACSGSPPPDAAATTTTAVTVTTTVSPTSPAAGSAAVSVTSSPSSSSASPADELAGADAEAVVRWLAAHGVPVAVTQVYDEDTDPNDRLGRPGGYTSKAAFQDARVPKDKYGDERDDPNRGGSVEVFADVQAAKARAREVQEKLAAYGLGSEYDYIVGGALVRVTGTVTPRQAKAYQSALGVAPEPAA